MDHDLDYKILTMDLDCDHIWSHYDNISTPLVNDTFVGILVCRCVVTWT